LTSNQRFTVAAIISGLFLLAGTSPCRAQTTPPPQDSFFLEPGGPNPGVVTDSVATDQPTVADPVASGTGQVGLPPEDSGWHFAVSPYLWFPGVHGTLGAGGHDASIHASPGDLLSHFRFGLMGAVEPRYKRLVLPFDMMWIRLGDNKALPNLEDTTASVKGTEFLMTQKVGYRVVDLEMIKIDALTGFRFWHFGENLKFSPSGFSFSNAQNWVDPLVGGRIQVALSPKIVVNILGDVGGWGTGSQLEYQVAGLLGYRIKPKLTLQAGFRYLYVDYTNRTRFATVVTSGVIFGTTYTIK
jgi:hypothetical protein